MPPPASQLPTLIISVIILLMFGASIAAVWLYAVPVANQRVADTAMGTLATLATLSGTRRLHIDPPAARKLEMIYASTPVADALPMVADDPPA